MVFVCPTGVMDQAVHAGGDFALGLGGGGSNGPQFLDELLAAAFQHLGGSVKDLATIVTRASGPTAGGAAGGDDGFPAILSGGAAGVGHEVALGVRHLDGSSGLGAGKGAAKVQLVGLGHLEAVLALGVLHRLPLPVDWSST